MWGANPHPCYLPQYGYNLLTSAWFDSKCGIRNIKQQHMKAVHCGSSFFVCLGGMVYKAMAGRKSKWDELEMDKNLILIEGWARDGYTDKDIMNSLGVSHNVFYQWKKEKKEFNETLKKGKEFTDRQVENALLKRAMGYSYDEVKEQQTVDGTFITTTRKEVVPDTTAQIFWLKNRKPQQWRDKQDINHSGGMSHKVDMSGLTTEELRAIAKRKSRDGE